MKRPPSGPPGTGRGKTPVVRGAITPTCYLVNAINRAVVENVPPRSALEEAVEQINKELARKQSRI